MYQIMKLWEDNGGTLIGNLWDGERCVQYTRVPFFSFLPSFFSSRTAMMMCLKCCVHTCILRSFILAACVVPFSVDEIETYVWHTEHPPSLCGRWCPRLSESVNTPEYLSLIISYENIYPLSLFGSLILSCFFLFYFVMKNCDRWFRDHAGYIFWGSVRVKLKTRWFKIQRLYI